MGAGEVPAGVVRAVLLVDVRGQHRGVELRVPGAVGPPVEADPARVARVDLRHVAQAQVGEGAPQVHLAVVEAGGAHRDAVRADRVHDREVPVRVDLAGRGIQHDGAHVLLAVDVREVADCEQLARGEREQVLHLVVEVEGHAREGARVHVERGQAPRFGDGAVSAGAHAREVAPHEHGGSDLLEGLDLDVALGVGAVEVARHAPLGGGRELRDGARHRGSGRALVGDAGEVGGVRGDPGAEVDLGVGEDGLADLAEEGSRRGRVTGVVLGPRAEAEPDREAVRPRRVGVVGVPRVVVAEAGVGPRRDDGTVVEGRVDGVAHLEEPHEVRHLGEAEIQGLEGRALGIQGAQDAHAVLEAGN